MRTVRQRSIVVLCGALLACAAHGEDWEFSTVFPSGFTMTGAATQAAEKSLEANPNDLNVRARLLGRYTYLARLSNNADARGSRLNHIAWLIEHAADTTLLHYSDAVLQSVDFTPPYQDRRAALIAAWQDQIRKQPDNVPVLANAALSLGAVDFHAVSGIYTRLRQSDPANPQWVLGLAGANLAVIHEEAGDNPSNLSASATQIRLLESNDEVVAGMTGQLVYSYGRCRSQIYQQMGQALIARARALNPGNQRWQRDIDILAPVPPNNATLLHLTTEQFFFRDLGAEDLRQGAPLPPFPRGSSRVTVDPAGQAAKLIDRPDPLTPRAPLAQSPLGVVFEAIVGTDGHVKIVRPLSGNVAIMQNAIDAVRHWTYRPTLQNGMPVEVATQIEVAFRQIPGSATPVGSVVGGLSGGACGSGFAALPQAPPPPPPPPPKPQAGNPASIVEAVSKANLLTAPDPVYPPLARQARIQGAVVLNVIIGKDGTVEGITVASGPPLLTPAAVEAVKKWTYKPMLMDGQPVSVSTRVTINFRLPTAQ
jgi:TonB family protein